MQKVYKGINSITGIQKSPKGNDKGIPKTKETLEEIIMEKYA